VFAVCRVSPGDHEMDVLLMNEPHPPTIARAARMVGEIGIASAESTLEYLLAHEVPEVREAAAWSLSVFQSKHKAVTQVLMAAGQEVEPHPDVLAMAARRLTAEHTLACLSPRCQRLKLSPSFQRSTAWRLETMPLGSRIRSEPVRSPRRAWPDSRFRSTQWRNRLHRQGRTSNHCCRL
jgi:hypothetical protein